jgi:predicted metal-binding protein
VFRDGETASQVRVRAPLRLPLFILEEAMTVTLHVCITCRAGQTLGEGETTPGKRLHGAILEAGVPEGVNVVPVECLSACSQGCSVALSAPGRWSYVYGRLSDANAQDVVAGVAAYAAAPDGIVPWRSRPEIFRKQSLARIPPLTVIPEAAE